MNGSRTSPVTGFTLIELLVTLAIMAAVMMALQVSLHTTIRVHDDVAIEIASVREGPRILDLIERDLESIHCYNILDDAVLQGKAETHRGVPADRLDLVTTVDSSQRLRDEEARGEPRMIASDVTEVGYRVRPNDELTDFLELWRREDVYVDDAPLEGGRYELLHDKITRFEVRYLETLEEEAEELEDWDMEERKSLPAAVTVLLELQAEPDLVGGFEDLELAEQRLYQFRRVIPMAHDRAQALRVRPALPVKIEEPAAGGGGGGGGDDRLGGGGGGGGGENNLMGGGDGGGRGGGEGGMRGGTAPGGGRGGRGGRGGDRGGQFQFSFDGLLDGGVDLGGDFDLSDDEKDQLDDLLRQYKDRFGDG